MSQIGVKQTYPYSLRADKSRMRCRAVVSALSIRKRSVLRVLIRELDQLVG